MKTIEKLTGELNENGEWLERRGAPASLIYEYKTVRTAPDGQTVLVTTHLHLHAGSAGLRIRRGPVEIGIPLEELLALALTHAPELVDAPAPRTGPVRRDRSGRPVRPTQTVGGTSSASPHLSPTNQE